jgi:hypothetical protein
MGINHRSHRALVYEPAEYGGFGVCHLYTEMMGMKFSHKKSGSQLVFSIIININYIQLHARISTPIFRSQDDISYVPMNWILHIQQFLIEINATLEIQELWVPKSSKPL